MLDDLERRGAAALLPGTGKRGYCAVHDGGVVGSAVAAERGRTAYLWGMYVLPEFQRSGIGTRLLATVAGSIQTVERLEARVLASSTWAETFYRKHGFVQVGEETTEVMADAQITKVMAAAVAHLREAGRGYAAGRFGSS